MNTRTPSLQEVWNAIESEIDSAQASLIRSALFRFTVPGLGGPKASGNRLKNKEAISALNFLATIAITPDTPEILRNAQSKTFEMLKIKKQRQRQPRYYLNQFIIFGIERKFFSNSLENLKPDTYTFYPEKVLERIKTTSQSRGSKFRLSLNPEDYISSGLEGDEAQTIERELKRIQSSLNSFESYKLNIQGNRKVTVCTLKIYLLRLLGWLYQEKQIPLTNLSINSIVPFVNLNPKLRDSSDKENPWMEQMLKKAIALEDIKEKAHELVEMLTEFFGWLENPPSLGTKNYYIASVIELAKYIYRNETDKSMALDFGDIPIITRLRIFSSDLKKSSKNKISNNQYIPWNEVIRVFEKLKIEADLETKKHYGKYHRKRSPSAIAKSLQDCIVLGMFILVPPSRQRVVRELELGRTLKYGVFINGQFTPAQEMSNPDEARYYIHLQPEDYKTGDTYGEWLAEFPNVKFSDGMCFYDYLNKWLFKGYQDDAGNWHGMREVLAQKNTCTVFVKERTGESIDLSAMGEKIKWIFKRWTKVPIRPHDLRHIYRSYIEDPATGASAEEKESAAFWMRHSKETAKKEYTHLDCERKLHLGAVLCDRINQQLLKTI